MATDGADPAVFSIDTTAADGRTTVAPMGELDLAHVDEFGAAVRAGLANGDVLADLRGLTFMDSAGVRALNTALREATESGRRLLVRAGMQPAVVQILELTGMMALLEVTEDAP